MTNTNNELTYEEFLHRAPFLIDAKPEILEVLYPMVRDLLIMAGEVNRFALHMDEKLDVNLLSETSIGDSE